MIPEVYTLIQRDDHGKIYSDLVLIFKNDIIGDHPHLWVWLEDDGNVTSYHRSVTMEETTEHEDVIAVRLNG